jgi:SHS2 domain-containing protein
LAGKACHRLHEGDKIDEEALKNLVRAAVKAVTLHDFRVEKIKGGWKAAVILDI